MTAMLAVPTVAAIPCDERMRRLATPLDHASEQFVDLGDRAGVRALLALTDPVDRHRSGEARVVLPADDYLGDYKEYVLAPFTRPYPSRFSDGSFGVLYAAADIETAAAEVAYWLGKAYRDGGIVAGTSPRKVHLSLRVCADLADVRLNASGISSLYDPEDYTISRAWGVALRQTHEGLKANSVRRTAGENVAVFLPRVISQIAIVETVEFEWDGAAFSAFKTIHSL